MRTFDNRIVTVYAEQDTEQWYLLPSIEVNRRMRWINFMWLCFGVSIMFVKKD